MGYKVSSTNFIAATSHLQISITCATFKHPIKIPFACMTLGLQLNCSSTIKRSLNALQFHGDTVKTRSHYPNSY